MGITPRARLKEPRHFVCVKKDGLTTPGKSLLDALILTNVTSPSVQPENAEQMRFAQILPENFRAFAHRDLPETRLSTVSTLMSVQEID